MTAVDGHVVAFGELSHVGSTPRSGVVFRKRTCVHPGRTRQCFARQAPTRCYVPDFFVGAGNGVLPWARASVSCSMRRVRVSGRTAVWMRFRKAKRLRPSSAAYTSVRSEEHTSELQSLMR